MQLALQLLAVQPDRHWPIVDKGNIHVRAEDAASDGDAVGSEGGFEAFDKGFGDGWRGGIGEAGPPTLASIGVEGELGDDQNLPADIK
jgi:hypothetical protein